MNNVKFIKPVEVANLSITGEISGAAVETLKETIQQGVDASAQIAEHNTSNASHSDIRLLVTELTNRLNAVANSTDIDLDQLSEIVAYIKDNRDLIEGVTTNKVNISDIINNLTTTASNKPLSANMGVELKKLINAIKIPTSLPASDVYDWAKQPTKPSYTASEVGALPANTPIPTVPTKISAFENDKKYLTSYTETDPTVPAWAKADTKPTYTASEVGALPDTTVIPTVPTKISAFENDAKYLNSYTETDPTVPDWAKASTKPSYTKSEVGLGNVDNVKQYSASNPPPYPVTKVNNKTGDVTLSAADVGADESGSSTLAVSRHDENTGSHSDIRQQISQLSSEIVDIKSESLQQTPLFANSIEECTDMSKMYVLPDGFIYAYMYTEKIVGGYKNLAEPLPNNTTDTTKWVNGYRFSSSGISAQSGTTISNEITCTNSDVIRIKGVALRENADRICTNATIHADGSAREDRGYYHAPSTIGGYALWSFDGQENGVYKFTVGNGNFTVNTIRFAMPTPEDASAVIVTVNEEIVEGTVVKEYAWANTNHAFVPNDYDEEFAELNAEIEQLKIDAVNLENANRALEESVEAVETKIEKIGTTEIPDYWQEHIAEKISTIKSLQDNGGKDCFSFVVMTDMHYPSNPSKKAPLLAKKVMDECDIRFALCLGDTQTRGCHADKTALLEENEHITEMFGPIKDRLLRTQGNHDGNYGTVNGEAYAYRITPQELHSHIYRKVGLVGDAHFDESGSGYWVDDTANKVRYILLNTHNTVYELNADGTQKYPNMHTFRFGQSQYDLVVEALTTIPSDGWAVVMGGHVALGTNGGYSAWGDGTTEGADCYLMENLLTAYKNKTSFNGNFIGTWGNDSVTVNCDFTSAKGNFVGFFGGHTHTDSVSVQGINRITTRCDAKEENNSTLNAERIIGTTTEQSFDVFTVNKATHTIYATKIGAGVDREISY